MGKSTVMSVKHDYLSLATSGNDELEAVMLSGTTPDMESLAGWEFRGFNSLDLTTLLGFRKFKKGFYRDGDAVRGYNVKVEQSGLIDPWVDQRARSGNVKHGWYDVYPVRTGEPDNLYPRALLLNYAAKRNPRWDPSRALRDYLVMVDPENPELYLGKAYVALGPRRLFVSYFVLERHNPSTL